VDGSGGLGEESGRGWWELKGMRKKWKEEKRKGKVSDIEKKRGVTMVLHVMLREGMNGCYEEKFVKTGEAMGDVRLLFGGERGIFGEGRHKLDLYKRHKMRGGESGEGGRGFSDKAKWGVAKAKRIWELVGEPTSDGGVTKGRVDAANEMIRLIHKDTRKRDRYASAATAMNCSSMDINRVLNWMMGMQRWDVLQQVEKAKGLLGATVVLCGECSTPQAEAVAAEKVVAVQRSIQDMRARFGCFRLCRPYVVNKGSLLVVVIIGPVFELAELQNCVVPFMIMLNPRATVSSKAPVSHLVARELFYAPAHSRRLVWAMANASLLLGHATSTEQSHKALAAALAGVLGQEATQGASWVQHAHDVTRARSAAIGMVVSRECHDVGMMSTILALSRGNMGCLVDNEAVRRLRSTTPTCMGGEVCMQWTSRLGELCSRSGFDKEGATSVSMAAAGLICGGTLAEHGGCLLRCPATEKTGPTLRTKHIRSLSDAGALGSWTTGHTKSCNRQFTGFSEKRGDKTQMALLRKVQRMAKAIQSRADGFTIVNKTGTTGLTGTPPRNLLLQGHPAFNTTALQRLVVFFRKAESRAFYKEGGELVLDGEDVLTCAAMHMFEYPCTVGTDGTARMLSDVFPATRTGTPMDELPYPASIIDAVYDPVQCDKTQARPNKPPPVRPAPPNTRQQIVQCSYFSQMWIGVDERTLN